MAASSAAAVAAYASARAASMTLDSRRTASAFMREIECMKPVSRSSVTSVVASLCNAGA